jgi:hypothetical protein
MVSFARWRAVIFIRLGAKIKGKMTRVGGSRLSVLLVILILLLIFSPIGSDYEQDQDHQQEEQGGGCALAVAHYNRSAQRP